MVVHVLIRRRCTILINMVQQADHHTIFKIVWCFGQGEERLRTSQKVCFCGRNGSVKPREEEFTKQTRVMLLGGWSADGVTA